MIRLQIGAHQRAGMSAEAFRAKGHIDGDDQGKGGCHRNIHRGRYGAYRIDQHGIDAGSDLVQQLLPVDAFQPAHQPARVGILRTQIGGPAGNVCLDLQIETVEGLHKLRDQQSESQHQHKHNAQQRDGKADKVDGFIRRLLSGLAEQTFQPLFQPTHGHVDKKCQNAACQNGQDQIHEFCRKGQNGGKPQQCNKKRYAHNSYEQILFGFWFHDEVPFPKPAAEICKETVCRLFSVL